MESVLRWGKKLILTLLVLCTSITLVLYLFEDRIIRKVVAQANSYLKVPVSVAKIEVHFWRSFPQISVAFEKLQVPDPLNQKDTLLNVAQLSLRFNPFDLIRGEYNVRQISSQNGIVKLASGQNGQVNYDIFKSSNADQTPFNLQLKKIALTDIRFEYKAANNTYALQGMIHSSSLSGRFSDVQTELKAEGLVQLWRIKKENTTLLKNQPLSFNLKVRYDQKKSALKLPQAQIKIAQLPFLIDGEFSPQQNSLDIRSQNLSLLRFIRLVSPANTKDLTHLKAKGKVDFQFHFQDSPKEELPNIGAYFSITNGELTEPNYGSKISNLQFYGAYQNLPIDAIRIEKFSFKSQGGSFNGAMKFEDFVRPKLELSLKGAIPLALVNRVYPMAEIKKIKGRAAINFKGLFTKGSGANWQTKNLSGKARIVAPQIHLSKFKNHFSDVSVLFIFHKNDLQMSELNLKIGHSDLSATFGMRNFLEQIHFNEVFHLDGKVWAKTLNLDDFRYAESTPNTQKQSIDKSTWATPTNLFLNFPIVIDQLQTNYGSYRGVKGTIHLSPRAMKCEALHFKHADGSWLGNVELKEQRPALFTIKGNANVRGLNLKTFFREWHNFDQQVLTAEQLYGKGQLDFDFYFKYDLNQGFDQSSLLARIDCQVHDGRLYRAPILQDLAKSLTFGKGRAILGEKNQAALQEKLSDVYFETLSNTVYIAKRNVRFEKMHIASSALAIDLVGQHSFDHQIDYAVSLRMRELLIQETQTEFGEILDDGSGLRLFVRCSGPLDDPKVSWDKNGKQQSAKQQFEKSQLESKAMLKSAFGLYQKDASVPQYEQKTTPQETIELHFENGSKPNKTSPQDQKPTKNGKLKQQLDKWKQEQQEQNKVEIKIGG